MKSVAIAIIFGALSITKYFGNAAPSDEKRYLAEVFDGTMLKLPDMRGVKYVGHGLRGSKGGKIEWIEYYVSVACPLTLEEARPLIVHAQQVFMECVNAHPKSKQYLENGLVSTYSVKISIYIEAGEEYDLYPYLQVAWVGDGRIEYRGMRSHELGPFDYSFSESWEEAVRIVEGESGCNAD